MSRRHAILISLALPATLLAGGCTHEPPPFVQALPDGPLVVGHRGGAQLAPENTIAAFEVAIHDPTIAAEVIELDVHTSADGELVVIHDHTADRVTGVGNGCDIEQDSQDETFGTVVVHDSTLAELQALDAGYCYRDPDAADDAPVDELHPYRGLGITIPTLREVLERYPDQLFVIEIKQHEPSVVDPLVELIYELDRFDRSCFLDFDGDGTEELRKAIPDDGCTALSDEGIRCWASEAIMPFGGGACEDYELGMIPHENGGFDLKKQRLVSNLQAVGTPVFMWTVNDDTLIDEVLDLGVDGVVTDRPDAVRQQIDAR